jgi:hypothetical protein
MENNDITSLIKKVKTLFDSTWLLKSGAPDGRYYIFSLLYWNKMIRACSYLRWFLIIRKKYYDTYLSQHSRKQQITWNSKRSKKDEQAKSKKKKVKHLDRHTERIHRFVHELASYSIRNNDIEASDCCY